MKRMTVPALLAAAVLAFALVGCGQQAQNMSEDTLKGVWALDSGSDLGFDAYISFEDEQVVEMILADSWLDGTYSVSGASGSITFNSMYEEEESEEGSSSSASAERSAKLTYSNNKLTVGADNGSKLVFVKDDSEEAKSMFSFDFTDMDQMGAEDDDTQYVDEVIEDIAPVTIADDDKFTITVTGKGTDFTGDPCYRVSMTNKTDKAVYVVPEDVFKVGGKDIEAGLGDELEAGATIDTEIYFAQDELGGGVELLAGVDGVIQVLDDETDDEVAKYTFHMD